MFKEEETTNCDTETFEEDTTPIITPTASACAITETELVKFMIVIYI